jgi:hypothetical protein
MRVVAQPWTRDLRSSCAVRYAEGSQRVLALVRPGALGWEMRAGTSQPINGMSGGAAFDDRESAKRAADEILRTAGVRLRQAPKGCEIIGEEAASPPPKKAERVYREG